MSAIIILLVLGLSYLVGRWALGAMGIIMIDSLAGLIFKPMIWGFFILMFGIGIVGLLFKGLFMILGGLISLLVSLFPIIAIVVLICFIVKVMKNR
jgi:hypothetical protein